MTVTRVGYVTKDSSTGGLTQTIAPDSSIQTGDWMVMVLSYFTVQAVTPPQGGRSCTAT